MKLQTLDRKAVQTLSDEMQTALKPIADKYGIHFSPKGARYSSTSSVFKFECSVVGDGGVVETPERRDYKSMCEMYDLKPEWLDCRFQHGNDSFIITGLSTRKRKNPVMCKNVRTGRAFKFTTFTVKAAMSW